MRGLSKIRLAFVATLLAACQTTPLDPEAALRTRVSGYYGALEKQDFRAAYGYLTPGYRSAHAFMEYAQLHRPPGRHAEMEILKISCPSDDACEVLGSSQFEFDKSVQPVGGMSVPMQTRDRWLNVEGEWYLVPKR